MALTFSSGEVIETTAEHPFYVEHKGFVPAGLLAIGNAIVTRAGPSLSITGIEKKNAPQRVYNFTVEDFHTYFVGEFGIWVHNAGCGDVLLGFKNNLTSFKTMLGKGKHYGDVGIDPWDPEAPQLLRKLMDDADDIHFDLTNMNMINAPGGVLDPAAARLNTPPTTNWELMVVWNDAALKGKTKFYRDGRELTHNEVLQLP